MFTEEDVLETVTSLTASGKKSSGIVTVHVKVTATHEISKTASKQKAKTTGEIYLDFELESTTASNPEQTKTWISGPVEGHPDYWVRIMEAGKVKKKTKVTYEDPHR